MVYKYIRNFSRNERGAVSVIEAAIIYPVVILTVAVMLYIGIYIYETALLKDKAENTAVQAAKSISFAGYNELSEGEYNTSDNISFSLINSAYEDNKPYRYIVKGKVSDKFSKDAADYASGLIISSDSVNCDIEVKRHLLNREVKVTINKNIAMPQMFSLLEMNAEYGIHVCASALTSDPAEFIRNTDFTVNTVTYLSERFHINEKLQPLREKITELLRRLGIGGKDEKK